MLVSWTELSAMSEKPRSQRVGFGSHLCHICVTLGSWSQFLFSEMRERDQMI